MNHCTIQWLFAAEMLWEFQKQVPWTSHDVHAHHWPKNKGNFHDSCPHYQAITSPDTPSVHNLKQVDQHKIFWIKMHLRKYVVSQNVLRWNWYWKNVLWIPANCPDLTVLILKFQMFAGMLMTKVTKMLALWYNPSIGNNITWSLCCQNYHRTCLTWILD